MSDDAMEAAVKDFKMITEEEAMLRKGLGAIASVVAFYGYTTGKIGVENVVTLAGSGATWYCGPKQRHRTKKKKHPPTVECIIVKVNTVANFSVVKISEHVITTAVASVVEDDAKIEGPM